MTWVGVIVADQLGFYWETSLWPRLLGLTDDEYFWEPVDGAWSVRQGADGVWKPDGVGEEPPDPPPVTTLAWRITHVAVGVFYTRASTFFGDASPFPGERRAPGDATMFDERHLPERFPGSAKEALELLDLSYRWWRDGLLSLDDEAFLRPLGSRGAFFAEQSMAQLALHLNRETMHHGGEIGALRDLYRATGAKARTDRLTVSRAGVVSQEER
jgi:hypothetical protein